MEKLETSSGGFEDSEGMRKINETYSDLISQGYRWATNTGIREATDRRVADYQRKGLDVKVEPLTFDAHGKVMENCNVVFIREPQKASKSE